MDNLTYNKDSLRSRVDTFILEALAKEDRYGYEILKEIDEKCKGAFVLKQPTLYSCLKRLESKDFIKSYLGDESNGGQRRYYSLTDIGREHLIQDVKEWEFSRTIINKLLSDREFDFESETSPFAVNDLKPLTKRDRPKSLNIKDEDFNSNDNDLDIIDNADENDSENNEIVKDLNNNQNNYISNKDILNQNNYVINEVKDDNRFVINEFKEENKAIINEFRDERKSNIISEPLNYKEKETVFTGKYKTIDEVFSKENLNLKKNDPEFENTPIITEVYDNRKKEIETEKPIYNSHNTSSKIEEYYEQNDIKYRPALDEIFAKKQIIPEKKNINTNNYSQDNNMDYWNRNEFIHNNTLELENNLKDLKGKLYNEGYNLRPYSNNISSRTYYSNSYIYSNRIRLETSVLLYLIMVIETFVTYFAAKSISGYSLGNHIMIALILAAYPFMNLIIYLLNPMLKKNSQKFVFRNSLLNSVMLYLIMIVLVILFGFFVFGADIYDIKSMLVPIIYPSILLLNIPIYICLYGLLFKTNKYHVK